MESAHPESNDETLLHEEQFQIPHLGENNHIPIKLFVGRLPTSTNENEIRPIFERFGTVTDVIVLRDKATGSHKSSAFVRMESIKDADAAIRVLSFTQDESTGIGPLQISYATGECERLGVNPGTLIPGEDEAKVFIGSLPKDVTEDEIIAFFSSYGKCHDPYLMKDTQTKRFKGCGFLKFEQKEDALLAIQALHKIANFPRSARPLEVRIAEPKRSIASNSGSTNIQRNNPSQYSISNKQTQSRGGNSFFWKQSQQQQTQQQHSQGNHLSPSSISQLNSNPRMFGSWKEYYTQEGRAYYYNSATALTQWEIPTEFLQAFSPDTRHHSSLNESTGPPGANVFVLHIPNDWTREDLSMRFSRFGHILSAMVAIDRSTQRTKGYGFVSYNNIRSALQAVNEMNMSSAGNKRLRVEIKDAEVDHARRYAEQHQIEMSGNSKYNSPSRSAHMPSEGRSNNYNRPSNNEQSSSNMDNYTHSQRNFVSSAGRLDYARTVHADDRSVNNTEHHPLVSSRPLPSNSYGTYVNQYNNSAASNSFNHHPR